MWHPKPSPASIMLIAYFVGSLLGGAISGLTFDLHGLTMSNIAMCMAAKIFLMLVFVAIDVIVSVAAKQKAWLCLCGSLGAGMLLFMMVSMIHAAQFYGSACGPLPRRWCPICHWLGCLQQPNFEKDKSGVTLSAARKTCRRF